MQTYKTVIVKQYPPGCKGVGEIGKIVVRIQNAAAFDGNLALNAVCRLFHSSNSGLILGIEPEDTAPAFVESRSPDWHDADQPAWIVNESLPMINEG